MSLTDLLSFKTGPQTNAQRMGLRMVGYPDSLVSRIPTPLILEIGRTVGAPPTVLTIETRIRSFRQKQLLAGAVIAVVLYLFMKG